MKVINADCIEAMADMDEASVDAIVTDPPYGLGFMGKQWDDLPPGPEFAEQALRVLKPGGHLLAFGGTRTYHRLTVAIEDAGFEIRDCLMWLYGSGFPKSLDVSKAIDKAAGAEHLREFVSKNPASRPMNHTTGETSTGWKAPPRPDKTAPATDAAKEWEGWGTALKPAHEPIVLARKPLEGTVAANVQKWGTGALNIDACRIGVNGGTKKEGADRAESQQSKSISAYGNGLQGPFGSPVEGLGRWPANLALDETAATMLDEQSGERPSTGTPTRAPTPGRTESGGYGDWAGAGHQGPLYADTGGASRFFYCAKASKSERNAGLDGFDIQRPDVRTRTGMGTFDEKGVQPQQNHHPTVKPISLMRYLCRLITPPGGTVLDPFTGSGTTGIAAALEGFDFIGIEREAEYAEIARARIEHWHKQPKQEALL